MKSANTDSEAPLVSHLLELRDRILRVLIVIGVLCLMVLPFADYLYTFFASPLIRVLPAEASMISTEPHGPFFVPIKLAFAAVIGLCIPYLLYQLWAFVAPGLYAHEQQLVLPLIVSSSALFYLGILFAYFVVFPIIFPFFVHTAPQGVTVMTDINAYLNFCIKLFFAFGVAFEVPVATVLLCRMGVSTPDDLAQKRPYVVILAFVIGMLLTPPDMFSQTMLAIPVWLLFELGLIAARRGAKKRAESEESNALVQASTGEKDQD